MDPRTLLPQSNDPHPFFRHLSVQTQISYQFFTSFWTVNFTRQRRRLLGLAHLPSADLLSAQLLYSRFCSPFLRPKPCFLSGESWCGSRHLAAAIPLVIKDYYFRTP